MENVPTTYGAFLVQITEQSTNTFISLISTILLKQTRFAGWFHNDTSLRNMFVFIFLWNRFKIGNQFCKAHGTGFINSCYHDYFFKFKVEPMVLNIL